MDATASLAANYLSTGAVPDLPTGHFIDGAWAAPRRGQHMDSEDPGKGRSFARFARGTADDVSDAVASARHAFGVWRDTSPPERGAILAKAAALLRSELERFAVIECIDSGKPLHEARGDVAGAARCFEYYAGACDKLEGSTFPLANGYLGYSMFEPVGVTAQIIPWNFPLSTAARGIAPALAAGCTVVAKPAEQTPFTALILADLLCRAGLPGGACNVVTGTGSEAGAPLVSHPRVDHITFTGSVMTGTSVLHAAADNVTRTVMELGGKSPVVVLDDCDVDAVVQGVAGAIFENAGQICSAGSRLVITGGVHDEVLDRLVALARGLKLGHGLTQHDMGPVNSEAQLDKINGFLRRAGARAVDVLVGGKRATGPATEAGYFFEPTIVADCPEDDELVQEEIFGPVLTVQKAEDEAHALHLANGTRYGLVAGVYTSDFSAAHRLAKAIDAGQVYINEYFAGGIEVPFGGNSLSGFGREKGMEGLRSYCKVKSIAARI